MICNIQYFDKDNTSICYKTDINTLDELKNIYNKYKQSKNGVVLIEFNENVPIVSIDWEE